MLRKSFRKQIKPYQFSSNQQLFESLDNNLSLSQKKYLNLLADEISKLQKTEVEILAQAINENYAQKRDYNLISSFRNDLDMDFEQNIDEQWFDQNLAAKINSTSQEFKDLFSSSNQGQEVQEQEVEQVQEKEEVKVEKTNFDIELISIDASAKIKIIKEVRSIFGLGLKEAKDAVEKIPGVLKPLVLKAEAEQIKENLEKLGCKIELK